MGERGPIPKRDSQRRRRNKESKAETVAYDGTVTDAPLAVSAWHPAAKRFYEALPESGQTKFFEPSDWQAAQLLMGELSVYLRSKKRSAMMWSHIWAGINDLLSTEAARRRVKLEVERTPPPSEDDEDAATITSLDEFRDRAAG